MRNKKTTTTKKATTKKATTKTTTIKKTTQKLKAQKVDKKQKEKLADLYKVQNEYRSQIAKQSYDYNKSISESIRNYFNNNYIKVISYKECYQTDNGSYNYRVFVKSDKKLPKNFTNSKFENDVKTMVLVNDTTRHIKCAIDLEASENYKAF